jgi:hypothetical protein
MGKTLLDPLIPLPLQYASPPASDTVAIVGHRLALLFWLVLRLVPSASNEILCQLLLTHPKGSP